MILTIITDIFRIIFTWCNDNIYYIGIVSAVYLFVFLAWFILKPISRDQLLVSFGWKYFMHVVLIMVSCTAVIAATLAIDGWEPIASENNWVRATQFSLKMVEAKDGDLNIFSFILVMLFQVVVFEGLVLATIVGWTGRRAKRYQNGEVRYRLVAFRGLCRRNSYAVVIGANEVAPSVIKNLLKHENKKNNSLNFAHEKEDKYVILQTSSNIEKVRQMLQAYLTEDEYNRVIIYSDLRNSYEGLEALHLLHASEIYVLGENSTMDGGENYHDTMNMRCVNMIARVLIHKATSRMLQLQINRLDKIIQYLDNIKNDVDNNSPTGAIAKLIKKIIAFILNGFLSKKCRIIQCIEKRIEEHKKVCKVLFEYQTTYSVFQFSDVIDDVKRAVHFIPFNRYESWARRVMVDNKALALIDENDKEVHSQNEIEQNTILYTPLDGYDGIQYDSPQRVHFVVVGMSNMGIAMGTQALFQAHYPNYVNDNSLKSRITFIDANAEQEMQFFKGRYAALFELARHRYLDATTIKDYDLLNSQEECHLSSEAGGYKWIDPMCAPDYKWGHLSNQGKNFLDVEIEFVKGELESEGVREYLRRVTHPDQNSKVTIAICLPQTHQAVAAALYMPREVYDQVQEIWVYQREAADIIRNLTHDHADSHYRLLKPFGMLHGEYIDNRTYYLKSLIVNGLYDLQDNKDSLNSLDMGDKNTYKELRTSWNSLTVEKQWSNKYFSDLIYQKVRGIMPFQEKIDTEQRKRHEEMARGGYGNPMFNQCDLLLRLENALQSAEGLAECEHNRWNTQQLLLGFTPASCEIYKELTEKTVRLNSLKQQKKNSVLENNDNLNMLLQHIEYPYYKDLQDIRFKELLDFISKKKINLESEMLQLLLNIKKLEEEIDNINQRKRELKSPTNKIHYCICDFDHIDPVDPYAKDYDAMLNKGIPLILMHVDGYKMKAWHEMKKQNHRPSPPCPPHHS